MRVAAIDIGTNSIHMVIASATAHGTFEVVDRERELVQVGRGSFRTGRLKRDAIRRTVDALARYVQLARRHQVDRIVCTATAAVREAQNGGEFLQQAREASGVTPRVIPAEVEGRFNYLAIKSALQLPDEPSLMIDIGGGSMQLVAGTREELLRATSAPLGALRLTELLLRKDPPGKRDLQKLRRHIKKQAQPALEAVMREKPQAAFGSSGSIHALAQAIYWAETQQNLSQINGHFLPVASLEQFTQYLQGTTTSERASFPGIDARRAEIIVPAAMTLLHVLKTVGVDGMTVSDFGVREGLVTDFIETHGSEVTQLEKIADLRMRSVMRLLSKFHQTDDPHPHHVAKLALQLFDALRRDHKLGPDERELLHYAALLHDIGSAIAYDGHETHSAYIIRNGHLRGLSGDEIEMIALIARFHAKGRPRKRDETHDTLNRIQRRTVRWLAGIMQVVEGLDRSHYQLIESLRVVRGARRVSILIRARRDARLEFWAAKRRTGLLERLLEKPVVVKLDPAMTKRARTAVQARGDVAKRRKPVVLPLRKRAKG